MTLRDQYASALQTLGLVAIATRSRKFQAFQAPGGTGPVYFLGGRGSIRCGSCYTESIPIDGRKILNLAAQMK